MVNFFGYRKKNNKENISLALLYEKAKAKEENC